MIFSHGYVVINIDGLLPNNNSPYVKRLFLIFYSGIIRRFIGGRA